MVLVLIILIAADVGVHYFFKNIFPDERKQRVAYGAFCSMLGAVLMYLGNYLMEESYSYESEHKIGVMLAITGGISIAAGIAIIILGFFDRLTDILLEARRISSSSEQAAANSALSNAPKFCAGCGHKLNGGEFVCPGCGRPISQKNSPKISSQAQAKYCPHCDAKLRGNEKTCASCGKTVY